MTGDPGRASPSILVLDSNWDQTPYVIAALANSGFRVTLAGPMVVEAAALGRFCRHVPFCGSDDPRFVAEVAAYLQRHPHDIVFPTNELGIQRLADLPESLATRVFPRLSAGQQALLADRQRMYEAVAAAGVPVPRSVAMPSAASSQAAAEALGLPLVVRGTQGTSGQQVRIVADPQRLERAYTELQRVSPAPPFAQQFIQGPRCLVGALAVDGAVVQLFAQKTIEAYPAGTGPSIRVQSIDAERLADYAAKVYRLLNWNGLGCAEFIITDSDFVFLEFNPRPWAAIMAAERCGVPFLEMFAAFLKGQRNFVARRPRVDRECVLFPQFLYARLRRPRTLRFADFGAVVRSLADSPWRQPALMYHYLRRIWWAAAAPAVTSDHADTGSAAERG
ncbi:MAG: ATP-grasp domain-containing protein [Proteobacteria bacterium]|nr:ATP-grasp domain-containing protein [Pseudomonadota bacterium]